MIAEAIAQIDDREQFRAFVIEQLGKDANLRAGMNDKEYSGRLDHYIRSLPDPQPELSVERPGKPGRPAKYTWRGVPIRQLLSATHANSVRYRIRELGETMNEAMAWVQRRHGKSAIKGVRI